MMTRTVMLIMPQLIWMMRIASFSHAFVPSRWSHPANNRPRRLLLLNTGNTQVPVVLRVPVTTTVRRAVEEDQQQEEEEKEEDNNDNGDEDGGGIVLEPTVMVNGQELLIINDETNTTTSTTTTSTNDDIFGATAAMAVAVETPLETTLLNIQKAGLMDMDLVKVKVNIANSIDANDANDDAAAQGQNQNANADSNANANAVFYYKTPEELAPLVQGHRVALYFGAGWCPACRELEFMLPQYIKALCESEQKIRLIYVSSDASMEFQLDRMKKLSAQLRMNDNDNDNETSMIGVGTVEAAQKLKKQYGIWAGRESPIFLEQDDDANADADDDCTTRRRSGIPAFVVLDTEGGELKFLNTEAETIAAMGDWPLDDPKGIF